MGSFDSTSCSLLDSCQLRKSDLILSLCVLYQNPAEIAIVKMQVQLKLLVITDKVQEKKTSDFLLL